MPRTLTHTATGRCMRAATGVVLAAHAGAPAVVAAVALVAGVHLYRRLRRCRPSMGTLARIGAAVVLAGVAAP